MSISTSYRAMTVNHTARPSRQSPIAILPAALACFGYLGVTANTDPPDLQAPQRVAPVEPLGFGDHHLLDHDIDTCVSHGGDSAVISGEHAPADDADFQKRVAPNAVDDRVGAAVLCPVADEPGCSPPTIR